MGENPIFRSIVFKNYENSDITSFNGIVKS